MDDTPASAEPQEQFKLDGDTVILRGEFYVKNSETALAMQYVKDALSAVYKKIPNLSTDAETKLGQTQRTEILIGDTNRESSQEALKDLGINDYVYTVNSQKQVTICGGTPAATLEAAKKFCIDVLGYNPITKTVAEADILVTNGASYTYKDNYPYQNATLCGVALSDITIAVTASKLVPYAYETMQIFSKHTGNVLPIVDIKDLKGDEAGVICIGAYDRNGRSGLKNNLTGYVLTNSVANELLTVGINATKDAYFSNALIKLEQSLMLQENDGGVSFSLPQSDVTGIVAEYDVPDWFLMYETTDIIADGVIYTEQYYVDADDLPYRVYALTVDPTKVTLDMGCSEDGYAYSPATDKRQTTLDHMKAAVTNGKNVIAGVNADFFHINGDYHPQGIAIKDGKIIYKGESGRPYFAFTKDGKAMIGANGASAATQNLVTAVGGSHIIVNNGVPNDLDMEDSFGYTSHPRTLAGIKDDGTIVLAVVDGRQEKFSNGAPLARCAYLMIDFGCSKAINLDGGGSSTMIIKNGNTYDTMNRPSDGSLRKVYNSLLIVAK